MNADDFVQEAEAALRLGNHDDALKGFWAASKLAPTDSLVHMRLGLMLRRVGQEQEALEQFTIVTHLSPDWGEAWREKGIIEGIIARKIPAQDRPRWLRDGQASLERATHLNPDDFDAWSSLGGVLKNVQGDDAAAERMYRKAAEISDGHPYPLLNALRLEARRTGALDLDKYGDALEHAESLRRGQCEAHPPADPPWCFYDLAEIQLYRGNRNAFLDNVDRGIEGSGAWWQVDTFARSLRGLRELALNLDGLGEGIARLEQARERFATGG